MAAGDDAPALLLRRTVERNVTTYDRIARFYDVDMARNMPFDDVAFYAELCTHTPGPVLELGCGNGRILLELLRRGIDATGVDASGAMLDALRKKAAAQGLATRAICMDVRNLALRPGFNLVLCPYSLITYMVADDDVARFLANARRLLAPGGLLVIDAFVPRPLRAEGEFTLDYERPFGDATLTRWKRMRALDADRNRIERRYRLTAPDGTAIEEIDVAETIRPFTPAELRSAVTAAGMTPVREWWNYRATAALAEAQFFTLAARPIDATGAGDASSRPP
jgi:SAM-dependent methyltransferase